MSRRRVAWLVLGVVLVVSLCWAGPTCWRAFAYKEWHTVAQGTPGYDVQYDWGVVPRWASESDSWHEYEHVTVAFSQGYGLMVAWRAAGPQASTELYGQDGSPRWFETTPPLGLRTKGAEEVLEFIREARLAAQAAAQRGEVTLPPDWEYAQ